MELFVAFPILAVLAVLVFLPVWWRYKALKKNRNLEKKVAPELTHSFRFGQRVQGYRVIGMNLLLSGPRSTAPVLLHPGEIFIVCARIGKVLSTGRPTVDLEHCRRAIERALADGLLEAVACRNEPDLVRLMVQSSSQAGRNTSRAAEVERLLGETMPNPQPSSSPYRGPPSEPEPEVSEGFYLVLDGPFYFEGVTFHTNSTFIVREGRVYWGESNRLITPGQPEVLLRAIIEGRVQLIELDHAMEQVGQMVGQMGEAMREAIEAPMRQVNEILRNFPSGRVNVTTTTRRVQTRGSTLPKVKVKSNPKTKEPSNPPPSRYDRITSDDDDFG